MFIKRIKAGGHTYLQVVESYKEDGISKHKILLNLGRLDQNNETLKKLTKSLLSITNEKRFDINSLTGGNIFNYGYKAYEKLWKRLGLDLILNDISGEIQFSLPESSFFMCINHLMSPQSKLSMYNHKEQYFNLPDVKLHNIYRSLDILSENKEKIEDYLFFKNKDLFNLSIDVVFYDVTTFYFESVRKDSLRDFGFSKDNKLNEVQVVLGLLVDSFGRPVGYELFPGNTFEGKTIEASLIKLSQRFNINKIIVVADKGMNSKINLKKISDMGFKYIVSSRLKSLGKETLKNVFSEEGFIPVSEEFKYKKMDLSSGESLIVTYSEKRAMRDSQLREKLIKKANEYTETPSKIRSSNKRGGKKYIKESGSEYALDEEAISKDASFDGYYAVQTNEENLTPQEILSAYHNLWRVEESFRIMKSTLEVRPMFHWTEERIKGHFVICFLSFLMERTLEFKLREKNIEFSVNKIREALNSMKFSEITLNDETYIVKNKCLDLGNKIFSALRVKSPSNITPVKELNEQ